MEVKVLKRWAIKLLPIITIAFIIFVGKILYENISKINWSNVGNALSLVSWQTLAFAMVFVIANYAILTTYDYLGFKYLNIKSLRKYKIYPSAFVSYAFNFNLGALIGGLGFRYRIYTGWKIPKSQIGILVLFTVMTTWLGYIFLLSILLIFKSDWANYLPQLDPSLARALGIGTLLFIGFYFYLCHKKYILTINNKKLALPSVQLTLKQIMLSTIQWCLPSGIIYFFLQSLGTETSFGPVLFTYLIGAVAGVIARIPAGIGTIEAVFFKMDVANSDNTLAALLCFRFVYYLLPLAFAIISYFYIEYYQKKKGIRHQ